MQTVPKYIDVDKLREELSAVPGVISVHDFHVWTLIGTKIIASLHVVCLGKSNFMQIATNMKKIFHNHGVHTATIQPEFIDLEILKEQRDLCQLDCAEDNCRTERCCPPKKAEAMTDEDYQKIAKEADDAITKRKTGRRLSISS